MQAITGKFSGLEICCSLQVYVEVEPADSQLAKTAVKGLYWWVHRVYII